jgi:hypothetical protein
MPRDGAIIFGDLDGKLDMLRVTCDKCGRDGCYGLRRLIEKRGRDAKLLDWLYVCAVRYWPFLGRPTYCIELLTVRGSNCPAPSWSRTVDSRKEEPRYGVAALLFWLQSAVKPWLLLFMLTAPTLPSVVAGSRGRRFHHRGGPLLDWDAAAIHRCTQAAPIRKLAWRYISR